MKTKWLGYCHKCGGSVDLDYGWGLSFPTIHEKYVGEGKNRFCSPYCLIQHILSMENKMVSEKNKEKNAVFYAIKEEY